MVVWCVFYGQHLSTEELVLHAIYAKECDAKAFVDRNYHTLWVIEDYEVIE